MSSKYEQEIEEILRHVDEATPRRRQQNEQLKDSKPATPSANRPRLIRWSLSPGRLMVFSLILGLLGLVFRPFQSALMDPVIWAAVLLFIFSYALFFIRPGSNYQKRWRGRPVVESTPSWFLRLRWWLRNH